MRFYDIAANLTDSQFGSALQQKEEDKHRPYVDDRADVVQRAKAVGCTHLLIATGSIEDALHSHTLCHMFPNSYLTIGVHPCRAADTFRAPYTPQIYFNKLEEVLLQVKDKLVAIGECGLDYDRLQFSSKEEQLAVFEPHFDIANRYNLPLYLHNRNTGNDFFQIVHRNRHKFKTGVVHSFTGTKKELQSIVKLDLYIGINGCSLKTQQNLEVLRHVPLQRIMLETDSPYCGVKKKYQSSHLIKTKFQSKKKYTKGYLLKGRNQPCKIVEVLEIVSQILQVQPQKLAEIAFNNSIKLFHGM